MHTKSQPETGELLTFWHKEAALGLITELPATRSNIRVSIRVTQEGGGVAGRGMSRFSGDIRRATLHLIHRRQQAKTPTVNNKISL